MANITLESTKTGNRLVIDYPEDGNYFVAVLSFSRPGGEETHFDAEYKGPGKNFLAVIDKVSKQITGLAPDAALQLFRSSPKWTVTERIAKDPAELAYEELEEWKAEHAPDIFEKL